MDELKAKANGILSAIGQPNLTAQELAFLECWPHTTEVEFYSSLSKIVNKRSGNGDAVERLNNYAAYQGVDVKLEKYVPNNVFLGSVL